MLPRTSNPLVAALDPLPDGPFCVALSGGVDSTALLHVLADRCRARNRPLRALHVHHALSTNADAWALSCEAACGSLDVPLLVRRVDVDTTAGLGVEAAARGARRAAFADVLEPDEVLVLAHHRDDQAETFLLHALRGSGPDGLAAMRPYQPFAGGYLWRPWLSQPRAAIDAYAAANGLHWIEDDSNDDVRFDRNYLRRHVMPALRMRWPHVAEALGSAAAHCRDANDLLHDEDLDALATARTPEVNVLSISALRAMAAVRRARVLRAWIASLDLPPLPQSGVARIEADLLNARPDANAAFEWRGAVINAWRDLLHAGRVRAPLAATYAATWDGAEALALPDGGRLRLHGAARFATPVQVRSRQGGERITLPGRLHSHALRKVLQDLSVPTWRRAHLPLLFTADGALLAAGDLVRSACFDGWLRAHAAHISWQAPCD